MFVFVIKWYDRRKQSKQKFNSYIHFISRLNNFWYELNWIKKTRVESPMIAIQLVFNIEFRTNATLLVLTEGQY